jgi:hypothetical protein
MPGIRIASFQHCCFELRIRIRIPGSEKGYQKLRNPDPDDPVVGKKKE